MSNRNNNTSSTSMDLDMPINNTINYNKIDNTKNDIDEITFNLDTATEITHTFKPLVKKF